MIFNDLIKLIERICGSLFLKLWEKINYVKICVFLVFWYINSFCLKWINDFVNVYFLLLLGIVEYLG